jgi:hypothetical protein
VHEIACTETPSCTSSPSTWLYANDYAVPPSSTLAKPQVLLPLHYAYVVSVSSALYLLAGSIDGSSAGLEPHHPWPHLLAHQPWSLICSRLDRRSASSRCSPFMGPHPDDVAPLMTWQAT